MKLVTAGFCCFFLILFVIYGQPQVAEGGGGMQISSPDFKDNGMIPKRFTCDGQDVNPTLLIDNIPKNAKSLALIMDDPDAPMGTWVHWVVYNLPVINKIKENTSARLLSANQGMNDFRNTNYGGPCPPGGEHRYFFKVYALDKKLGLKDGIFKSTLEREMEGHIIEKAELIGLYKRQ